MKVSATVAGVSLLCCFGLFGVLLGIFGLTAALAYVNQYGDFVFFPAFAIFGTLFVYSMLKWKKNIYTYIVSAATAVFALYFMIFGLTFALLILGGIVIGGLIIWRIK